MDRAQLAHFRALLEQERDAIRRRLSENDHYGLASPLSTTTGELAAYDNHPADLGSEMYEREKDVALLEHDERQLEAIERALARIEAGTYGRCEVCGEPIPLERLEALPTAHTCVECTRDARVSERRPVEEEVLAPPFARTFDVQNESVVYDGEDAWQDVARYGTSEPPDFFRDGYDYDHLYLNADEPVGYVDQVEGFVFVNEENNDIDFVRNEAYEAYVQADEGDATNMVGAEDERIRRMIARVERLDDER
ncbi:TraR/DksA C4-type zinc finger protein [Calditerricola satsumensis]|uniref:Zinc finger DksA/TraR C4-type domain-containing protein n=1 Tax=Calditerricola satsumensis TaxID=373054 RepID=A0A8J3BAJ6_9BACI|nr:TraR/DksA C4-type zinc finger protein [Calditerricola satsumensis]GGJ92143.1 hypothetical protein GCM10007043_02290 [Calditerricola satsumensis]